MDEMDTYLMRCLDVIGRCGHLVQFVSGDDDFGDIPFAYTVGLSARTGMGFELAVTGLGAEACAVTLNALTNELAGGAGPPREGLALNGLVGGRPARLRVVGGGAPLFTVDRIYGMRPTVWQAVWPDARDRFPDEAGYDARRHPQPLL